MPGRIFVAIAALPLLVMAGLMVRSALIETQTFDEGVHLLAGYACLTKAACDLNWEHPPLGKLLWAAAVFPWRPKLQAQWWRQRRGYSWRHLAVSIAVAGSIALVTLLAVYHRYNLLAAASDRGDPVHDIVHRDSPVGSVLYWLSGRVPFPSHAYLLGLDLVAESSTGRETYLLGKVRETGTWQYFPVAFAVKTPTAMLLLAGVLVAALWRVRALDRLRQVPFHWFVLTLPPAIYFLVSMTSHLNIGHRHILPVYPFLFLIVAAAFVRRRWWAVLVVSASLQMYEYARIYPHYLAFFSTVSGGPERGPDYLVDSNIDWDQDLKNLRTWIDAHHFQSVCLLYFGRADRAYYGFSGREPPTAAEVAEWGSIPIASWRPA